MISSDTSDETIEKCKNLVCHDYHFKPIKIDKMHHSLKKCFFSHLGINRKHLRVYFNNEVELSHDGIEYELFSETLSEGGIYMRKEEPLPVGSEVSVKFPLNSLTSLKLKGSVIYKRELHGDFLTLPLGMAIQFKDMTQDESEILKIFIDGLIAKDILEDQKEKFIEI